MKTHYQEPFRRAKSEGCFARGEISPHATKNRFLTSLEMTSRSIRHPDEFRDRKSPEKQDVVVQKVGGTSIPACHEVQYGLISTDRNVCPIDIYTFWTTT